MKLTAEILAGVYEALRRCAPFQSWKLPPAEAITFQVTRHKDREGHYTRYVGTDEHFICVSGSRISHFDSLGVVMAHEMIHLFQALARHETRGEHNAHFRRCAGRVCKNLGFDPNVFC